MKLNNHYYKFIKECLFVFIFKTWIIIEVKLKRLFEINKIITFKLYYLIFFQMLITYFKIDLN